MDKTTDKPIVSKSNNETIIEDILLFENRSELINFNGNEYYKIIPISENTKRNADLEKKSLSELQIILMELMNKPKSWIIQESDKYNREELNDFQPRELYKLYKSIKPPKNEIVENSKETYNRIKVFHEVLENYNIDRYEEATELMTKFLTEKYYFKTISDEKKYSIFVYENGIYEEKGLNVIKTELRIGLGKAYTERKAMSVIDKLKIDTLIDTTEFLNSTSKDLTCLNNGILNTKTQEIIEHDPKHYFFTKIPVNYNKNADCPEIKKFVKELVNTEEAVKTVQEVFGYTLIRSYKLEKAIMLEGKTASNGKTELTKVFKNFLGHQNCSYTPIEDLDNRPFALKNLFAKHVNFCSEINKNALDGKGKFKVVTGNEDIEADRKGQTTIKFLNHAKFIFTANELPIPKNADDGFWRRWVRIEFPNRFLSQKEINAIPETQRTNIFLKNPDVADKISSKEEMEGLLIWALEGLERINKNKDFTHNKTIEQQKTEWLRKALSINAFIEDCIEIDYTNTEYIIKEDFRREYNKYCQKHKVKPLSDMNIKIALENDCFASSSRVRIRDENGYEIEQPSVWKGISFKKK